MKTILFQGDSITDADRVRDVAHDLGKGYPTYVAARLGLEAPNDYTFYNRGISGDRIVDIYARIKSDAINLKPDVMSLLVGVNDSGHECFWQNGVNTKKFKKIYSMLLDEILESNPKMTIILMEPFLLEGDFSAPHYPEFRKDVEAKAAVVQELAKEYNLPFIPLQKDLDALATTAPNSHWLSDGVHPTIFFHQFIADKWLETFRAL